MSCSEKMTSKALGSLACSGRTLLQRVDILKAWRHIIKSDSVNRCVFTWRTILPNFTLIRFETTSLDFLWRASSKKNKKKKISSGMRSVYDTQMSTESDGFLKCSDRLFRTLGQDIEKEPTVGWLLKNQVFIKIMNFNGKYVFELWKKHSSDKISIKKLRKTNEEEKQNCLDGSWELMTRSQRKKTTYDWLFEKRNYVRFNNSLCEYRRKIDMLAYTLIFLTEMRPIMCRLPRSRRT